MEGLRNSVLAGERRLGVTAREARHCLPHAERPNYHYCRLLFTEAHFQMFRVWTTPSPLGATSPIPTISVLAKDSMLISPGTGR
jgi:hypothetical protein